MKKVIENKDRIKQTHMTIQEAWKKYCELHPEVDEDIRELISLSIPINI